MHEYEFRLVVSSTSSYLPFVKSFGLPVQEQQVLYAKPHFRFKNNSWEIKRAISTEAVYHRGKWFRWVHSIETPFKKWSVQTHFNFLHVTGNFQNPFHIERRHVVQFDTHATLYTFQDSADSYRLVFEWEYGTFPKPVTLFDVEFLFSSLDRYQNIYEPMRGTPPPYKLNEAMCRKPVISVQKLPTGHFLYSNKLDGTFGLVLSYKSKLREKWEGYERLVRHDATLGDGLVFAAEKLRGGHVVLLDVYQVQGHPTSKWSRKAILTDFLPQLQLPDGYRVQFYTPELEKLNNSPFETDGLIAHNVVQDVIYKWKPQNSIDLVYYEGYFWLPNGKIATEKVLENGTVYEISTANGEVLRKRPDRFRGNTVKQLQRVIKQWNGPKIEPVLL